MALVEQTKRKGVMFTDNGDNVHSQIAIGA